MTRKFFGTDGIRGTANRWPITPDIALKVGMSVGLLMRQRQGRLRAVIGKDTRLSGYMIETAMVAGFTAVGVDVFMTGPIPTPAIAMLTRSLRCDIGVMISASHNLYQDNGIKIFGPDGYKLSDEIEASIETMLEEDLSSRLAAPAELGRAKRVDGVTDRYVEFVKRTMPRNQSLQGVRVVIDCGNGASYKVAPDALWELGAEVIKIGVEPDGYNINKDCGSTAPGKLIERVHETRADIGIALDGDADRVIIIDEKGRVVDGDQLMAVVASSFKDAGRLSQPGIVATVMSNLGLERYLGGIGLGLARTKVGDRYVVEYMREHGYNVGGEQSGHIILNDYSTTGDGLVAALQVLAVVQQVGRPVSEVCRRFDPVPQVLKNVRFGGLSPLQNDKVQESIAAGLQRLGSSGRLVIRPSGTEPLIRVMAEGDDERLVHLVVDDIVESLTRAAA
ncbi:MAG: phosphoglucosamine mutase [Ancalomicrobiaceae bacterium]|nr:phosphoglucosamine mutase [Ancalomicrobiaceae bacterium]